MDGHDKHELLRLTKNIDGLDERVLQVTEKIKKLRDEEQEIRKEKAKTYDKIKCLKTRLWSDTPEENTQIIAEYTTKYSVLLAEFPINYEGSLKDMLEMSKADVGDVYVMMLANLQKKASLTQSPSCLGTEAAQQYLVFKADRNIIRYDLLYECAAAL
jgi:hypothetical protein